jgi:hypothetical protein
MIGAVGNTQLATGRTWLIVIQRANYRCQCTGTCGATHQADDGRCPAEALSKALVAAAADPTTTTVSLCRVHADQLRAWCPRCLDGAAHKTNRNHNTEQIPGQLSLIDAIAAATT